jgi:hypothetical protein
LNVVVTIGRFATALFDRVFTGSAGTLSEYLQTAH